MRTFADVFDPRANGLNFVRLVLAAGVIVFHSIALSGGEIEFPPLYQFMGYVWVDGFFTVSGFLILRSWLSKPMWWRYLFARLIRIYPAFWVCLLVTAFVIAPVAGVIAKGGSWGQQISGANLEYFLGNATLVITQYDIAGTPAGVPYPGAWNGSLWTLVWEFGCYLAVLALGLFGAFRWRHTVLVVFGAALVLQILGDAGMVSHPLLHLASRFGLMFAAGMVLHQYSHRIPLTWPLIGLAGAVLVGSMFLSDYRIVGALFLAYIALGTGALIKARWARLRNDISYGTYIYAFPMQQLLATMGVFAWGLLPFVVLSIIATAIPAAASWFLVEKPALRLKPRSRTLPVSR